MRLAIVFIEHVFIDHEACRRYIYLHFSINKQNSTRLPAPRFTESCFFRFSHFVYEARNARSHSHSRNENQSTQEDACPEDRFDAVQLPRHCSVDFSIAKIAENFI